MKKKDLKMELYAAQTLVLELQEQIATLNDQEELIKVLFEKIKELKASAGHNHVIDLEKVAECI